MKRCVLTIIIVLVTFLWGEAQTVIEVRHLKTIALDVFDKYVSAIQSINDRSKIYNEIEFLNLFDANALIYNDILPQNNPQKISPKNYYDKYEEIVKSNKFTTFSNLKICFPKANRDGWIIICTFSKETSYITNYDYVYPLWKFNYIMTIQIYNEFDGNNSVKNNIAKIIEIDVDNPLRDFFILRKQNLTVYGNPISWGDDSCRIFSAEEYDISDFKLICNEKSNFFYRNISEWIMDDRDSHYYYSQSSFLQRDLIGVGINYSPVSLGNRMSLRNAERFVGIDSYGSALSLSLFWNKQIAHKNKSTFFFNLGLDFNQYYFKYHGKDYVEYGAVDSDAEFYLRKIRINSLKEKVNNFSLSLPLGFSMYQQIIEKRDNSFFLKIGVGGYFDYFINSTNHYNINADYHGLYDYYGGVEFDCYYDYGNFDLSGKKKLLGFDDLRYDYGVFSQIGFYMSLKDKYLIGLDVMYRHSFVTPLEYKENLTISENYETYNSLLYCTNQGVRNVYMSLTFFAIITKKKHKKT